MPTLPERSSEARRRYVILAEGAFGELPSKTAMGVIRYGRDPVVAIIDSRQAGRDASEWLGPGHRIPIVASLSEALAFPPPVVPPTALLIGIAPQGGRIPLAWRAILASAIEAGLDIVSGLHELISEDPELTALAAAHGVELVDHRRPPERHEVAVGRAHRPGSRVILTVGTDCAIGKMSVALELRRAAEAAGLSAVFVPTGQTGIMIEGWGVAIDRVISDFVNGTAEWLVERAEQMGDWIFVEGQGAIDHPAYSAVTVGLVHGATPHAMVLVHEPGRVGHHGWEGADGLGSPLRSIGENIRLYEAVASAVAPSNVVAIALNTGRLPEAAARAEITRTAHETGLPVDDPVRFGADALFAAMRRGLETTA
jgi:uncharacterized NAD-dependent epimerase/dehydratase family protein